MHTHFYKHLIGKRENECDSQRMAGKKDSIHLRATESLAIVEIRIALWRGIFFCGNYFTLQTISMELVFPRLLGCCALPRWKSELAQGKMRQNRKETRARRSQMNLYKLAHSKANSNTTRQPINIL